MVKSVILAFHRASMENNVVAVIFTGSGNKAFCTGGNTREYAENYAGRPSAYLKYMRLFNDMVSGILGCDKPVICRVNGMRIGGGQEIGMACDYSIAQDLARFGQAGPKHGSAPDGGSTDFLPLFTGLVLTGALMSVFNVKLNFINIVMLPSVVGIMIDHCIYLSHHILDYSKGASLKSLQETGSSIILSALTSLAGYASLNIAHHQGIRSIASVVELGIITCTICALFMLPALFELRKNRSSFTRFKKD